MDSEDPGGAGSRAGGSTVISSASTYLAGKLNSASSFDDCYASAGSGYSDAFALLNSGGGVSKSAGNTPSNIASLTGSPGRKQRAFFPTTPKRTKNTAEAHFSRQASSPRQQSPSVRAAANDNIRDVELTGGPPATPSPQKMPDPPSGRKPARPADQAASPPNPNLQQVTPNSKTVKNMIRSSSPTPKGVVEGSIRSPSPLRASSPSSRVKKMTNTLKRHIRSRSRGSGNYSDAVSRALNTPPSKDELERVDIIDNPKSVGSGRGVEVVSSPKKSMPSPNKASRLVRTVEGEPWLAKRRVRNRSPSPVRYMNETAPDISDGNASATTHDSSLQIERGSTASTPSFFVARNVRAMSPGRVKESWKKRNIKSDKSNGVPRPPTHSQQRDVVPQITPSFSTDVEDVQRVMPSLARTTMSFDIDDAPNRVHENSGVGSGSFDSFKDREGAFDRTCEDKDDDLQSAQDSEGYYINTFAFNLFECRQFLIAMGGNASNASLATNYIRTADALCDETKYVRAIQTYYAGLGVILARVRDWIYALKSDEEQRTANGVPPTHVAQEDFVRVACDPDMNIIMLIVSSILHRAGNAHLHLCQYSEACRDYNSAQTYRSMRNKSHDLTLNDEDDMLQGRISNNLACALSKRGLLDEARSEYTRALQVKQGILEMWHKRSKQSATSIEEDGDMPLVSDITSTFHNIGLLRVKCNELKKAEKAYKQSLSLRVKKFGLDDVGVSTTLCALGGLYYQQGQYDDAFRAFKESLRIWQKHVGKKNDLVTAEHYYNIGLIFYQKGPVSKARASLVECLRLRKQLCGDNLLPVASALSLSGMINTMAGAHEEAASQLLEALEIRQQADRNEGHDLMTIQLSLGNVYQLQNKFDDAMDCYSAILAEWMGRFGSDHAKVAQVLQSIGSAYLAADKYDKAKTTLEEVLRIRRLLEPQSVEMAETLDSLGRVLYKLGDTEKAGELGEEALEVLKSAAKDNSEPILLSKVMKNLGDYYQDVEAFEDAIDAYEECQRVLVAWHGEDHASLVEVLNEIGVTRFKSEEFGVAKYSFEEALRVMRLPQNGAQDTVIFPTLNHLGHALYKNNDLDLAAETYIESFNIQVSIITGDANDGLKEFGSKLSTIKDRISSIEQGSDQLKSLSGSLGSIANILRYIGLVIQDQGDFEAALSANKLSLSVRLCQPIRDHSAVALMAETIAISEYKRGNHSNALDYFSQALEAKKAVQGDTIDVARTVNNLANIHYSMGNLDDAMRLYSQSLDIKRICLGQESDEVVNTLNNIAHVMINAGREQDALEAYHEVLKIRQSCHGKSHLSVASTLSNMGDVYIKLGKIDIATTYFEQCIRIQKMHQGSCDERVLENLGSIYGKLGEWNKAETTFKEIIHLKRMSQGDDCSENAKILDLLAVSFIEQDRYSDAIEHLQEALRIRKFNLHEEDDEILASLNKLAFVYKSLQMTEKMLEVKAEFDEIQRRRRNS